MHLVIQTNKYIISWSFKKKMNGQINTILYLYKGEINIPKLFKALFIMFFTALNQKSNKSISINYCKKYSIQKNIN